MAKLPSLRLPGRTIQQLLDQAQEHQDKADKHHDSIFLLCLIIMITKDVLDWVGASLLGVLFAPLVWMTNLYLWFQNRDDWGPDDWTAMIITAIMEALPFIDLFPTATGNVIRKWIKSAMNAKMHQEEADRLTAKAQQMMIKQRATMQIQYDTSSDEDESADSVAEEDTMIPITAQDDDEQEEKPVARPLSPSNKVINFNERRAAKASQKAQNKKAA